MREGDLVLTPIPQAKGQAKNRPVLVLREMPPFHDLLVCGVSSQLHQRVSGFDETIAPADPDCAASGAIAPDRHARLPCNLSNYLIKDLYAAGPGCAVNFQPVRPIYPYREGHSAACPHPACSAGVPSGALLEVWVDRL
jgi:hypothetical protein